MKKVDLTEGNILKVLITLALPIMGSSLMQFTYNLVDMMWVGNLGSDAVASVGSSSLFVNLGYSINSLVVIGTGIKVAHGAGRKDEKETSEYMNAGLIVNTVIGLLYGAILIFFGRQLIGFLKLRNETVERDAYRYLAVFAPTLFFSFYNMLYIRVLNSFGNNTAAFIISFIGVILNIFLDPLFIYIFKMGVTGAAIATLVATFIMFILFNIIGRKVLSYQKGKAPGRDKIKEVVYLGIPMAAQRVLFTLIGIALARIIAKFGSDAIAAQKIGLQIESVTFMVVGGLNGAVAGFVGQNYGAQKYGRIHKGYRGALAIGIVYSILTAILFLSIPEVLASFFVKEASTIAIAVSYLRVVGFVQIFSSIEMISNGMFTGLGKPRIPATISIVFTALRIPFALVFTPYMGVTGIWVSIALSSVLKGSIAYLVYHIKVRREYKDALSV